MGELINLNSSTPNLSSFEELIPAPISLASDTWQELGSARVIGEQGKGALWDILVYFQYTAPNSPPQNYFQYCGGGTLAVVYWQADFLTNEGILIPFETHNDPDFTARIRFGNGQARKLEIKPSRDINIVSPGFARINGMRKNFPTNS